MLLLCEYILINREVSPVGLLQCMGSGKCFTVEKKGWISNIHVCNFNL